MVYNYGLHKERLSHMTTVVMTGGARQLSYLRDTYFGYHYENGRGRDMDFGTLIRLVKQKRYGEIHQVFGARYTRPVLGRATDTGDNHRWLYEDYSLPDPLVFSDRKVWLGAHVSFERLFAPGTDNGTRLDAARGDMPREHYLLAMIAIGVQTFVPKFDPARVKDQDVVRAMQVLVRELLSA